MASTHAATPGGPSVPPRSSRARRISHIDATIARIAADQLGVISNRQVAQHGISRQALNRRQHTGVLVPMFLGVYRLTATPASNLQRAWAACIGVPNSAISGRWAALIHGFPLPTQHFGHLNVSLAISHGRNQN